MEPTDLRTTVTTHAGAPHVEVTTYAELCALADETAPFAALSPDEREVVEDLLYRWHGAKCQLAALGPDHPAVSTRLSNLAMVLKDLGDAAAAKPLLERAVRIDEAALGPDHPEVATDLSNLALVLQDLGDAAAAKPLLERAVAILDTRVGPSHPSTRVARNNLSRLQASSSNA